MKDPEFHEFFKQGAKCILRVQNYVCVPNPEIGTNPPKNPNSNFYCVFRIAAAEEIVFTPLFTLILGKHVFHTTVCIDFRQKSVGNDQGL